MLLNSSISLLLCVVGLAPSCLGQDLEQRKQWWSTHIQGWTWQDPERRSDGILSELERNADASYDVTLHLIPKVFPRGYRIRINKGNREVFNFFAHDRTSFLITGDRLFVAVYATYMTGAELHCIDLLNGKSRWKKRLAGIGLVGHSDYSNIIFIEREPRDSSIAVHGKESLGNYSEIIDAETGETLAHRSDRKK